MMPDNPIVGGVALRRPAIRSPNFVTGVSGWTINVDGSAEFNNLTIRGTFLGVDFIINSSGLFFYTGTPALGNLAVSLVPGTTNVLDPEGNTAVPGLAAYAVSGGQTLVTTIGLSNNGFGLIFENLTTAVFADPSIAANLLAPLVQGCQLFFASGRTTSAATGALMELMDSVASTVAGGGWLVQSGNNQLQGNANNFTPLNFSTLAGGAQWPMSGSNSDPTHFTVTQAAFTRCTTQWGLNNDPRVGTVYRLTTWGLGTWGSTQQALNFRGNITGGVGLGQINFGAILLPINTAFTWKVIQELQILTTGPTGTWEATIDAIVSVGAGNMLPATGANGTVSGTRRGNGSLDTTNLSFWIEGDWGSTTGAPTFTSQGSIIERLGP